MGSVGKTCRKLWTGELYDVLVSKETFFYITKERSSVMILSFFLVSLSSSRYTRVLTRSYLGFLFSRVLSSVLVILLCFFALPLWFDRSFCLEFCINSNPDELII
jgi:hypothetical protein